jgi:hypothetical protein
MLRAWQTLWYVHADRYLRNDAILSYRAVRGLSGILYASAFHRARQIEQTEHFERQTFLRRFCRWILPR